MSVIADLFIAALLGIGGLFGLIGSYGLLRLRTPMQRLHAPTKATTVGVGTALIASAFHQVWLMGAVSWHEVLVAVFLFVTAPLTALYLAKTHLRGTEDRSLLPPTGTSADWTGFETTGADKPGQI